MRKIIKLFACVIVFSIMTLSLPVYAAGDIVVYAEDYTAAHKNITSGWMNAEWETMVIQRSGQWLEYEVNSLKDQVYNVTALLGRGEGAKSDMTVTNKTNSSVAKGMIDFTGDYMRTEEFDLGQIELKKGKNTLRVTLGNMIIYLERLTFSPLNSFEDTLSFPKTEGAYREHYIPTVLEAEDYDAGILGSFSKDGKNGGAVYREDDPMDIYETKKNSGNYYVDIWDNEWVNYTVECTASGVYDIFVNFFNIGKVNVYVDDNPTPLYCNSRDKTGEIKAGSVYLTEGTHKLKIASDLGMVSVDKIAVVSSKNTENVFEPDKDYIKKEEDTVATKNPVYKSFYVSEDGSDENDGTMEKPFKTIARARDEVAKVNQDMTGDIYVYIESGYYKQDETLVFTDKDGGKNGFNVVYSGASPFSETVIGGGIHVTGWEKTDTEIYKAHLDTKNDIRNMYVSDYPAQRARSKYLYKPIEYFKNEDSKYKYDAIKFPKKNFPKEFYDPERLEVVYNIMWENPRQHPTEIIYGEDEVIFQMQQPYFSFLQKAQANPRANECYPYFENDLTLLDEPGEFYYDIKNETIFYIPREGESLDEVYVADTEFLIKVSGSGLDNKVENLHFERLSFKYSAWYETNRGVNFGQAEYLTRYDEKGTEVLQMIPSQIEVTYAKGIDFKDCVFIGLGSTALGMPNAVSDSNIVGNIFRDTPGSAISIDHIDHLDKLPEGHERVTNILIKNNVLRRTSYEYMQSCGIIVYYANTVKILNNDIRELPYSGISLGWGFGYWNVTECAYHEIAYNRIENVMGPTTDGSHIYILGHNRNSTIHDNYMNETHAYEGGLYFDQGARHMKAYNNVMSGNTQWVFARGNVGIGDLDIFNNYADTTVKNVDPLNTNVHDNFFELDYKTKGWSEEAQAIIDASGVEDGYKRLLNEVEKPEYVDNNLFRTAPNDGFVGRNCYINARTFVDYYKSDNTYPMVYTSGYTGVTNAGQWMEYEANVLETGKYNLILSAANGDANVMPKVKIYVDGVVFNEGAEVPNVKKNEWTPVDVDCGEIVLDKGLHTIRFERTDRDFLLAGFKFATETEQIENDPEYDEGKLASELVKVEPAVFNDLVGHWAQEWVLGLYNEKIIKGTSENEFSPEREITLYETMLIIMRILDEDENAVNEKLSEIGYADKVADINKPVSREEFCDILMKVYKSIKGNYKMMADYNAFSDFSQIKEDYHLSVWGAKELGLFKGDTINNFNPQKTLTRAEAATVISRLSILIK